jgi:hypothetical protein
MRDADLRVPRVSHVVTGCMDCLCGRVKLHSTHWQGQAKEFVSGVHRGGSKATRGTQSPVGQSNLEIRVIKVHTGTRSYGASPHDRLCFENVNVTFLARPYYCSPRTLAAVSPETKTWNRHYSDRLVTVSLKCKIKDMEI